METAGALCEWLAKGRDSQRDKLAALRAQLLPAIAALTDADHRRVIREVKKRLNSPKLATEVGELLGVLARAYAPEPPPPPAPGPVVPPPADPDDRRAFAYE